MGTGRYFVSIIGGKERRSEERLRADGHIVVPLSLSVPLSLAVLIVYGVLPAGFLLYLINLGLHAVTGDPCGLTGWRCH